jgi:hypothetical protein
MAVRGLDIDELEAQADQEEGPFGDHLRRLLNMLSHNAELAGVVRDVIRGSPCATAESFHRLRSGGILTGNSVRHARPRCQLYALYLARHLL